MTCTKNLDLILLNKYFTYPEMHSTRKLTEKIIAMSQRDRFIEAIYYKVHFMLASRISG